MFRKVGFFWVSTCTKKQSKSRCATTRPSGEVVSSMFCACSVFSNFSEDFQFLHLLSVLCPLFALQQKSLALRASFLFLSRSCFCPSTCFLRAAPFHSSAEFQEAPGKLNTYNISWKDATQAAHKGTTPRFSHGSEVHKQLPPTHEANHRHLLQGKSIYFQFPNY